MKRFSKLFQWILLGWTDVLLEYRRTRIGPLWQTLHIVILATGLVIVFGNMRQGISNFPAYVLSGLMLWSFMSSTIIGGGKVFTRYAYLIRNIPAPLELYIVRLTTIFLIRFGFHLVAYIGAIFVLDVAINWTVLWVVPAMILYVFTALWVIPLSGIWITRFPDFDPLMESVMRFFFFLTPVFWGPGGSSIRQYLYLYNPFTHFLSVFREPLLGAAPPALSWIVALAVSVTGALVTAYIYARKRNYIVFWL